MENFGQPRRLLGIDAARLVAILGMFAAHVFALYESTGDTTYFPTFTGAVASGRASVLFMVLAGLSLTLMTKSLTREGFSHPKIYSVLAMRALIITVLGMLIGSINEGVAVILVHYGLLFLLLPLALNLPSITIWVVSTLWLILTPIIWRPLAAGWLGQSLGHNPSFGDLAAPAQLFKDITVTGYYPLMIWFGYGLLGICLARCNLKSQRTALWFSVAGSLVAIGSYVVGRMISLGFSDRIAEATNVLPISVSTLITTGRLPGANLDPYLAASEYLWLPTGHSNSLLATLHAAGCAVAVIGVLLLVIPRLHVLGRALAGAGRAPLTLYVGHLLILPALQVVVEPMVVWWILCTITAGFGVWLGFTKASGPLEYCLRFFSGADSAPKELNRSPEND